MFCGTKTTIKCNFYRWLWKLCITSLQSSPPLPSTPVNYTCGARHLGFWSWPPQLRGRLFFFEIVPKLLVFMSISMLLNNPSELQNITLYFWSFLLLTNYLQYCYGIILCEIFKDKVESRKSVNVKHVFYLSLVY